MVSIVTYAFFFFCILILGTISGIFSERVGIVNIAINGFILFGAIMYCLISIIFSDVLMPHIVGKQSGGSPWNQIWITLLASALTSVFALLFGFATIKLKSDQTISGFAINILSAGIVAALIWILLLFQNLGETLSFRGRNELALSPSTLSYKNIVSFKTFITIFIIISALFLLNKTKFGLRYKAIGENPQAVDVAGVNVNKIKWIGIIIAGFIAGIAGSLYAQNNIPGLSSTKGVQGFGFIALAIMITSRWKVTYAIVVSLIFSFLISASFYGVEIMPPKIAQYATLYYAIPYLLTLIIMVFTSKNTSGPAATGIPYDKSKR